MYVIDQWESAGNLSRVLQLHNSNVQLSHINIDPLRIVTDETEVKLRWKRLGLNLPVSILTNLTRRCSLA